MTEPSSAQSSGHERPQGRLLVVDDEKTITELLSTALRYMGWRSIASRRSGRPWASNPPPGPPRPAIRRDLRPLERVTATAELVHPARCSAERLVRG